MIIDFHKLKENPEGVSWSFERIMSSVSTGSAHRLRNLIFHLQRSKILPSLRDYNNFPIKYKAG